MFEKIIRYVLELRTMKENVFKKLDLRDESFIVTQYWDKENQIDLIVEHARDRVSRIIEIKWLNDKGLSLNKLYQDLELKECYISKNFSRQNFLAISSDFKKINLKIPIIMASDLF